jgi:hypothetical protein
MSTVGSASATDSATNEPAWASVSSHGQDGEYSEAEKMSMDTNYSDIDERGRYSAMDVSEDGNDGMSDEGNASLTGFGEGAGSTVSGPTYMPSRASQIQAAGRGIGSEGGYIFHEQETSNDFLRKAAKNRAEEIDVLEKLIETRSSGDIRNFCESTSIENEKVCKLWDLGVLLPALETISPWLPPGKPLRACILAIIWELAQWPLNAPISLTKKCLSLLISAACYQSTSPGVSTAPIYSLQLYDN